jgi:hypothetical protein
MENQKFDSEERERERERERKREREREREREKERKKERKTKTYPIRGREEMNHIHNAFNEFVNRRQIFFDLNEGVISKKKTTTMNEKVKSTRFDFEIRMTLCVVCHSNDFVN